MQELEIIILIAVTILLLISFWHMSNPYKPLKRRREHKSEPFYSAQTKAPGLEGYNTKNLTSTTDWQQEIDNIGVDPATKFSHKEWTSELLGRTTGASPWTTRDDDINSNWVGLRWGNTWKKVYAQPGARVSESNDWQDMPADAALRWRCHEYIADKVTPKDCPWPPQTDQRF